MLGALALDAAGEVVGGDDQARVEVEAVGVGALEADAGVEVELVAAEAGCLVGEPVEQGTAVAAATGGGVGREVVDVEVVAPGQVVALAEAGHGEGIRVALLERPDEAIALEPLHLVDLPDELLFARGLRPQGQHRLEGQPRVGGKELADHGDAPAARWRQVQAPASAAPPAERTPPMAPR